MKGLPGRLAWSTDSQRIIFAPYGEPFAPYGNLLEININGGKPRPLMFAQDAFQPAIAPRGERLAYVRAQNTVNIWRADLGSGFSRKLLAPTTREQLSPDISPDGKRIVFESNRSGFQEVWTANADGSDAVQLSNFHAITGTPHWSPDGQQIVFDSRGPAGPALFLVDPKTALPKQIATNGLPASVPSWSTDGKWIYFRAGPLPSSPEGLYRVATQGGTPQLLSRTVGYNVQQSKDGRVLYLFSGETNSAIHVLNIATGEEQPLKGMPIVGYPTDWVVGSKGIFFIDRESTPANIRFFDFSSERVTRQIPLEKQPEVWGGLALAPDETWIAYSQIDEIAADLVLVDGFR
jgi:Tol biopolymer transport system component